MKISRNLSNLCILLKEQFNWDAEPTTFARTYAGSRLKSGGAFSWTMRVHDGKGYKFEIGSCYPLKSFSKRNTIVDFSLSWGDTEIFPYTPEEYRKIMLIREKQNNAKECE